MSGRYDCATCRDTGFIAPRWQDDSDQPVPCPVPGCIAGAEHAWDLESACPTAGPQQENAS